MVSSYWDSEEYGICTNIEYRNNNRNVTDYHNRYKERKNTRKDAL